MITSIHRFDLHISQYIFEKSHNSSYFFYTIDTCSCYWHLDLNTNMVPELTAAVATLDPLAAQYMKPKT